MSDNTKHKNTDVTNLDIQDFPASPGVYLMKDAEGAVLYVGKAKNLRQRIRSYFQPGRGDERISIPFLQRKVSGVDFVVTENEKEALLLENTLIKKHKPYYNVRLRDDKTYLSLRINPKNSFPRLEIIRRRTPGDGTYYFGPFSSSAALKDTLRFVQRIFPLRMCKDSQFKNRSRPCLMYQVGKCLAPCTKPVSEKEYKRLVEGVILFLRGKREDVVKHLEKIMLDYAEHMEFEKAALIRDKIASIRDTIETQKVTSHRAFDLDAIGFAREYSRVVISVLHYRKGMLEGKRDFELLVYEDESSAILHSFIGQFYSPEKFIPPEIVVPVLPEDAEILAEWLADLRGGRVGMWVAHRGEKRKILDLSNENARRKLITEKEKHDDREQLFEKVQKALGMSTAPRRIECFDISNILGTLSVGSMVSFFDGEPDKNQYRRFKIHTVHAPDDYAMMKEVLNRRYRRIINESRELPDLILIDGGKGQLNIAKEVLRELGIKNVHLAAIAKGRDRFAAQHKSNQDDKIPEHDHIYLPNRKNPLNIKQGSAALLFLERIRDEAHRFAISFHKKLRSKHQVASELDNIEGIGRARRRLLLKHFGSIEKIRTATLDELLSVKGLPDTIVHAVYKHYHPETKHE